MTLIKWSDQDNNLLAMQNWFGVHATSIPNYNHRISPDNKGYAAIEVEKDRDKNFLALFAQGDAGDISPNYLWDSEHGITRGKFKDPFESARFNGSLQAQKANEILNSNSELEISGDIDCEQVFIDFSKVYIDDEFLPEKFKKRKIRTTPACFGAAFLAGTVEGPGMNGFLKFISQHTARFLRTVEVLYYPFFGKERREGIKRKYLSQFPKDIIVEAGEKRILITPNMTKLVLPADADPFVAEIKKSYKEGSIKENTWAQEVLPIQIACIGNIALVSLPAEPSFIAGQRIVNTLKPILAKKGIKEVITSPYSNAYCGYIVTPEEYMHQCYEGGHTIFGRWTLPAFQTELVKLANEMLKSKSERNLDRELRPPRFSQSELGMRTYPNG